MRRGKHFRKKRHFSRMVSLILLAALIGYPFYEARNLQVEQKTLLIEYLPADLNNLRIVFVSDIHAGAMFSRQQVWNLIQRINTLNPDIVLLGGDYAEDSEGAIRFFQEMPSINARYLVAGVAGNHDRTQPETNLGRLTSAMLAANVIPLVNKTTSVKIGSGIVTVAGIDDPDNGHPDIQSVSQMTSGDEFVIFLSHSPAIIPEAHNATNREGRSRWFNLALCGHTHGGQVTLLGNPLIPEFLKVERRYLSGWIEENRVPILTSNGVGTAYLPVRLFAPPQIHLITLKGS